MKNLYKNKIRPGHFYKLIELIDLSRNIFLAAKGPVNMPKMEFRNNEFHIIASFEILIEST